MANAAQVKIGMTLLHGHDNLQFVQPTMQREIRGWLIFEEHAAEFMEQAIRSSAYPMMRTFWKDQFKPAIHSAEGWWEHVTRGGRAYDVLELGRLAASQGKQLALQAWNERKPYDLDNVRAMGEFDADAGELLSQFEGLALVGANYSTGTSSTAWFMAYQNSRLRTLWRSGVVKLGIHSYAVDSGGPWSWMGKWQGSDIMPSDGQLPPMMRPGLEAWAFGRWAGHQRIPIPPYVQIYLTETGSDAYQDDRIRQFGGYVESIPLLRRTFGVNNGAYFYGNQILGWHDRFLQQLPNVIVAYYFGLGSHHEAETGDGGQFKNFDIARTKAINGWWDLVDAGGVVSMRDVERQHRWWALGKGALAYGLGLS